MFGARAASKAGPQGKGRRQRAQVSGIELHVEPASRHAELMQRRRTLPLEIGDLSGELRAVGGRLVDVELGHEPCVESFTRDVERLFRRLQRLLRDDDLRIERAHSPYGTVP